MTERINKVMLEETYTIALTDDDIVSGERGHSEKDAIAQAALRVIPAIRACVAPAVLVVHTEDEEAWYSLPDEAQQFVADVDRDAWEHLRPFEFTVKRMHRRVIPATVASSHANALHRFQRRLSKKIKALLRGRW